MKNILSTCILSVIFLLTCYSQDLQAVDSIVLSYPSSYKNPSILAKRIAKDFSTEIEQTRAVYTWITEHIAYSYEESKPTTQIYNSYQNDLKLSYDMALRILQTKQAICSGYSQLFQSLMNELDIESRIILGTAKTSVEDIGKALSIDHAWNMVTIDDKNYLIDATWGAGSWKNGFIKDPTDFYFMTKPELFAQKHYPEDSKDLLLTKTLSQKEFSSKPLLFSTYMKDINIVTPAKGILERKPNKNKYTFVLETTLQEEWISYKLGPKSITPKFEKTPKGYKFIVDLDKNPKARSMTLFFGSSALAAYRIK